MISLLYLVRCSHYLRGWIDELGGNGVAFNCVQELVLFLSEMIDDYEQKYDIVVDRAEFEGEIVVPQHLRKSGGSGGGGGRNNRMSSGILGSLTRSRTLISMSGSQGNVTTVHGSVPDLSRSSVLTVAGSGKGISTPLLEESSDYKLKESGAGGSESALDVDSLMLMGAGASGGGGQKITKSRGKKLYAAKSTNYLFDEDGVQLRRDSEEYYKGRQSGGGGGGGGADGLEGEPSQLMKSFQSRNLSMDRTWTGRASTSPPPPPSRASSTMLHNHFHSTYNNNSNSNNTTPSNPHYHQHLVQSNHFHYDPTRYQNTTMSLNHNNNNRYSGGSANSISIMSVNNSNNGQRSSNGGSMIGGTSSPTTTSSATAHTNNNHNTSHYSPNVRRWDEGRSSLSRRPFGGLTSRSVSTNSLSSIGSTASKTDKSSTGKGALRAKQQLELQKMKAFNSYAAIGSLDRKVKNKNVRQSSNATATMTLDRSSLVNNNTTRTGDGGGGGSNGTGSRSEVVAIRTSIQGNKIEGSEGGPRESYKIPRPIVERTLSEDQNGPNEVQEYRQQQLRMATDMGIDIVQHPHLILGNESGGQKIVLRTFGGSADVLFCESSSDGHFAAVDFNEEDVNDDDCDGKSLGVNDSAA